MNKYNSLNYEDLDYHDTHQNRNLNSTVTKRSNYFGTIKDNNVKLEYPLFYPDENGSEGIWVTFAPVTPEAGSAFALPCPSPLTVTVYISASLTA